MANHSRQNDCKIIKTDIITHAPCRNIEKIRIIKSAIQKTFILGVILPGGYTKTRRKTNRKSG